MDSCTWPRLLRSDGEPGNSHAGKREPWPATRPDGCCRRTLDGIHGVVDRMQGPACPFDRLGCHGPLHRATGVHSTADTARNKQPGEETHLHSQDEQTTGLKRLLRWQACVPRSPPPSREGPVVMLGIQEPDSEIQDTVAFAREVHRCPAQGRAAVVAWDLAAGARLRLASWSWTPARHCARRRRGSQ